MKHCEIWTASCEKSVNIWEWNWKIAKKLTKFGWFLNAERNRRASRNRKKRDILQFVFILAEQSACCTIWAHASHHRQIFFDSVQPLPALSAQRALCTFFSLLLSASLLRCGLMVSSSGPCASSGGRLPEVFFLVFRLESERAEVYKSCRSRQELSNESLVYFSSTSSLFSISFSKY